MPVYIVGYAKRMLHYQEPTILLPRRYLNTRLAIDLIHEKFENLNSIPNIFRETHDFLVLMESVIICIYLRKSQRKFL